MPNRFKMLPQLVVIACFFWLSSQAYAQAVKGIAYVEAPEQASGWCLGEDAGQTISCALEKCIAAGGTKQDCQLVKYCYPSLWAADLFQQHKEGLHWHRFLCGWQSEGDLDRVIKTACDGSVADYLAVCKVVAKWSPDGKRLPVSE